MCLTVAAGLLWPLPAATAGAQQAPPEAPAISFEAELSTAPHRVAGVPNVAVHVPAGFRAQAPLHLVVYLHGLRGCLPQLMGSGPQRCRAGDAPRPGGNLGAHHDAAGTNTIFIVPQLAYHVRGGQPGAFGSPRGFRSFLVDLLAGPLTTRLGRTCDLHDVASLTLIAHSAGYETALAILEHGEVASLVRAVVLMDALYALEERYARHVLAHADALRLVVIHLRGGRPARAGHALQRRLLRELGQHRVTEASADTLRAAIATHAFVFAEGRPPHGQVPQHHLAEVLAALALPMRAVP